MPDAPRGVVTFVFSDIEGSTRLVAEHGDAYADVLERHRDIVRECLARTGGHLMSFHGDGTAMVFQRAEASLVFGRDLQRRILEEKWADGISLRVRIGAHTGEAAPGADGDYVALAVHQAARVLSSAHGGQTLVSAATAEAATSAPRGCVLEKLGDFLVRDFSGAVALHELVDDTVPRRLLAPRAPRAGDQAALRRTTFVGRHEEQRLIEELLADHPIVTVVGAGGVGKTRLVQETLARAGEVRAQHFVALTSIGKDDDVPSAVGRSLGLKEPADGDWVGTVANFLTSSASVLVLDNCEHVILGVAGLVDELVSRSMTLRVLATSREALRVDGERVVPLGPLPTPPPETPVSRLLTVGSVRLFVERAVAAGAPAVQDAADLAAGAEVVRHLDGIPLALELAAPLVAEVGFSGVAEAMSARFEVLTQGRRTAPERHQSLRAVVDWSYSLLHEDEQQLFRAVCAASGVIDEPLARELASPESSFLDSGRTAELLERLAERSLLVPQGEGTYTLLETLREFGRVALVEHAELEPVGGRLQEWYRRLVDVARAERNRHFATITDDVGMAGALEFGPLDDPLRYGRLAVGVAELWNHRGRHRDAAAVARRALMELESVAEDPSVPVLALTAVLARELSYIGDPDALEVASHAVAGLTREHAAADRAIVYFSEATVLLYVGEIARAREAYRSAYEAHLEVGFADAAAQIGVGLCHGILGEWAQAREWLTEARASARAAGDVVSESIAIGNLTEVATLTGDHHGARMLLVERARLLVVLEDPSMAAAWLRTAAQVLDEDERWVEASEAMATASAIEEAAVIVRAGDTHRRAEELVIALRERVGAAGFDGAWQRGWKADWRAGLEHARRALGEPGGGAGPTGDHE